MRMKERMNLARKLVSYLPYSPCGVTEDEIKYDMGDTHHTIANIVFDAQYFFGVNIEKKDMGNKYEYWIGEGEVNREKAEKLCLEVLEGDKK